MLQAGEIIRTGNKVYRVEYVTEMRAFCVPIKAIRTAVPDVGVPDPEDVVVEAPAGQKVKGINISPNSLVERVTEEELRRGLDKPARPEKERTMGAAAIPVANETRRGEKDRKDSKAAARARANAEAGIGRKGGTGKLKAAKAAKEKKPKEMRKCLCGCGGQTASYFVMGHDSRFKSWMVQVERGDMTPDELPAVVRKAYQFKKKGNGFVTTHDYRGNAHAGYDNGKVKTPSRKN